MELSAQGLAARGLGEETFLAPLQDSIRQGAVQADRLLAAWATGGDEGLAAAVSL